MRRIDIDELRLRHRRLDQKIHELDRRGFHMTPEDRLRALELKKERLAMKDQIYAMSSAMRGR